MKKFQQCILLKERLSMQSTNFGTVKLKNAFAYYDSILCFEGFTRRVVKVTVPFGYFSVYL